MSVDAWLHAAGALGLVSALCLVIVDRMMGERTHRNVTAADDPAGIVVPTPTLYDQATEDDYDRP